MTDHLRDIAKKVIESFFHSRHYANGMHNRGGFGQKPGEAMVLYSIKMFAKNEPSGLMVSEISSKLNVTSPTVTQHINSLEAQGLVERHADPADRRIVRIRLTEKGEAYIQRINEKRLNMVVGLVQHLGEEESLRFAETMRKASDYMMKQHEIHMRNMLSDGDEKH